MRILVLNWWDRANPRAGGAETHLSHLFGGIARRGHRVTLLCCGHRGAPDRATLDGIDVRRLGSESSLTLRAPPWFLRHRREFDLVVDYTNKIPFGTPLFVPHPRLAVAHHLNGAAFLDELGPLAGRGCMAAERLLLGALYRRETFLAVSRDTAAELAEAGVDPAGIHVVHSGADHILPPAGVAPSPSPLILCLGRLRRYKRVDHVLEALAVVRRRVPEARLAVVGVGPDLSRLRERTASLGLGRAVDFTGPLPQEELRRLTASAWVTASASRKEGWGLGVMEAARCGVPATGYLVPGLRESILDQETGLLVPDGHSDLLGEALGRLLTDAPLRERLGREAARRAATFRWEEAVGSVLSILESLAGRVS